VRRFPVIAAQLSRAQHDFTGAQVSSVFRAPATAKADGVRYGSVAPLNAHDARGARCRAKSGVPRSVRVSQIARVEGFPAQAAHARVA